MVQENYREEKACDKRHNNNNNNNNNKGKFYPRTGHEGPEGKWMNSSTLSSTSAVDEGECSTPRPGRFTSGKDPVPILQGLGGSQARSRWVRTISLYRDQIPGSTNNNNNNSNNNNVPQYKLCSQQRG